MKSTEDRLVEKIAAAARPGGSRWPPLRLGPGDDAALWRPRPGREAILTCDWFLQGTHFRRAKHPPDSVGWKSLARAVSDIAAMGGEPRCFLLSLALPRTHTGRWLDQFLAGLRRAAQHFGCRLAGGDTTRREEILINVTVLGEVRKGEAVLRSGAKAGDLVFVSGHLGEAEFGLRTLRLGRTAHRLNSPGVNRHLYPEPRLALGQWLAQRRMATSMIDLSDGLSSDLSRLCAASKVGARIIASRIPTLSPAREKRRNALDLLRLALHGGDDYELLFTVRPSRTQSLPSAFQGLSLHRIGEVTRGRQLILIAPDGRKQLLVARGWDPFRKRR